MNLRSRLRKSALVALLLASVHVAAADPILVEIAIAQGKPQGGVRTVRVESGASLVLAARSDEPIEVHLHGYDVKFSVAANARASVKFQAKLVGRFPVTAHLQGAAGKKAREPTLLYLEVHPR
jgi:hypothetical protein